MKPLKLQKELTIRDSRAVDLYFSEINKYRTLTADEEAELCERIQAGDKRAKELLVLHNLRFVISVAKKYQSLGLRLGDLIAIGNIGILRAAEKFDYTKGFKFISYAVWWIRQQIMSEVGYKGNGIKLPSNRVTVMYKISKFRDRFYTDNWREPTIEEIADEFDMATDLVRDIIFASEDTESLNGPAFGDEESGKELIDFYVSDDEGCDERVSESDYYERLVRDSMYVLSPREKIIVELTYGFDGVTLDIHEIASVLNISKESAKQHLRSAQEKLKSEIESRIGEYGK